MPVQVCIKILELAYSTLRQKITLYYCLRIGLSQLKSFDKKNASTSMYQHTITGIFNVEAKNSIIILFKNETISIVKFRPKKCQFKYVSTYLHWRIQR